MADLTAVLTFEQALMDNIRERVERMVEAGASEPPDALLRGEWRVQPFGMIWTVADSRGVQRWKMATGNPGSVAKYSGHTVPGDGLDWNISATQPSGKTRKTGDTSGMIVG